MTFSPPVDWRCQLAVDATTTDVGESGMTRHRPEPGHLPPRDDPRVVAAAGAMRCLGAFDWRDVAEVVNAVLAADDAVSQITDRSDATHQCSVWTKRARGCWQCLDCGASSADALTEHGP